MDIPDCPTNHGPYKCYLADSAYAHRNGFHKAPSPKGMTQKKWKVTQADRRRWATAEYSMTNPLIDTLAQQVCNEGVRFLQSTGQLDKETLEKIISLLSVHHPVYDQLVADMDFAPSFMMLQWDAQARLYEERMNRYASPTGV